jgi:hypothetical protein
MLLSPNLKEHVPREGGTRPRRIRMGTQVIKGKMEMAGVVGPIWIAAWLFTIGFTHLSFGKAILGLALWPYYLGRALG